jgi:hypothetical protein
MNSKSNAEKRTKQHSEVESCYSKDSISYASASENRPKDSENPNSRKRVKKDVRLLDDDSDSDLPVVKRKKGIS